METRAYLPGGNRIPRAIRSVVLVVSSLVLVAGLAGPAWAQEECHDWDADGALEGWRCEEATDCLDLSWDLRPGAIERCNGLDEDCDGDPDPGCDRWCDEPFLQAPWVTLPQEGYEGTSHDVAVVRTKNGFLTAAGYQEEPDWNLSRLFVRSWNDEARPLSPGYPLVTTDPDEWPKEWAVRIAWAGDRALVLWYEHPYADVQPKLLARVVDGTGRPVAPTIDLSTPTGEHPAVEQARWPLWDGDRFVVFWISASDRHLYMSTIDRNGNPGSPVSLLVHELPDTSSSPGTRENVAFWNGSRYLVFYQEPTEPVDNLRLLRFRRDGSVDGPPKQFPLTMEEGLTGTWTGETIVLAWAEDEPREEVTHHLAFFDRDGYQVAPEEVLLRTSPLPDTDEMPKEPCLAWTGEMIGVGAGLSHRFGLDAASRWVLWRVLPDGTVLDPDGVVLRDDETTTRDFLGLLWSGREFWVFGRRRVPESGFEVLIRQTVACSCADADGDGYDGCLEMDCDDGNEAVHPYATEVCRGWVDDDCDGSIDCDDVEDCPGASGPGAVHDLHWDGTALAWTEPAGAEVYDLARGLVSDVRRRGDLLASECAGIELAEPSWPDDGRRPPAGDALWYLVRPEGEPCARGPWGVDVEREIRACR